MSKAIIEPNRCKAVVPERGQFHFPPSSCASAARIGLCPLFIFVSASSIEYHAARSTSGNSAIRPERGGHSSENVLLFSVAGSKSPSHAQAAMVLLLGCLCAPRSRNAPATVMPVSSRNSRLAAARRSSPSSARPLGIDHAPSSFFAQNGPPGWTSITSRPAGRRRNNKIPALSFGIVVVPGSASAASHIRRSPLFYPGGAVRQASFTNTYEQHMLINTGDSEIAP